MNHITWGRIWDISPHVKKNVENFPTQCNNERGEKKGFCP